MSNSITKIQAIMVATFFVAVGSAIGQTPETQRSRIPSQQAVRNPAMGEPSKFDRVMYVETFKRAKACLENNLRNEHLYNQLAICESEHGKASPHACQAQEHRLASNLASQDSQTSRLTCSKDPDALYVQFGDATAKAAAAGDVDAQMCYVDGYWGTSAKFDPSFYVETASRYIDKALERGDWRVLEVLSTTRDEVAAGGAGRKVNLPVIGSPFTIYRAGVLLEKGITGPYLIVVRGKTMDAKALLSAAQINNAKTWAAREYKLHFSKSPALDHRPEVCLSDAGSAP